MDVTDVWVANDEGTEIVRARDGQHITRLVAGNGAGGRCSGVLAQTTAAEGIPGPGPRDQERIHLALP
jgi:hypothetical protein